MAYHFPTEVGIENELKREDDDQLTVNDPDFSLKELESAIRSLNRDKAPGLDGLPLKVII